MSESDPAALSVRQKDLRLLKRNERVQRGDFVADGGHGFELWDGPPGFSADAFLKPIYRRRGRQATKARNVP